MLLSKIIKDKRLSDYNIKIKEDFEVKGISCNSRKIKEGFIFFAIEGYKVDGNNFIDSAIDNGAKLIVTSKNIKNKKAEIIKIDNVRLVYSIICSCFYKNIPDNLVAVTGTNGKTSVANFCKQIWNLMGIDSACIGTLGVFTNDIELTQEGTVTLTTPDTETLHYSLEVIKEKNINNVAIEASSQGMHQERLSGLKFKVGAFTNLSRDHLDYHGSYGEYLKAKMILFKRLVEEGGYAILNSDIKEFEYIKDECKQSKLKVISYGKESEDIRLVGIYPKPNGQMMVFEVNNVLYKLLIPLVGEFQVYNILCAIGIVMYSGANIDKIVSTLTRLKSVSGRMEKVSIHPKGAGIYVDYAHTPDGLEQALKSLRPHVQKNLKVLFGCGGDRDKGKRAEMGKVAAEFADSVIVTDDNPRTEEPEEIRKEIMAACPEAVEVEGRDKAIEYAVSDLENGDVLLVAGKGHEDYQIIGEDKIDFDDRLVVCKYVEKLKDSVSS